MFRGTDSSGALQGGPMYYMTQGMGKWAKPMAVFFSIAGLFGVLPAFTANQFTQTLIDVVRPQVNIYEMSVLNWKILIGVLVLVGVFRTAFGTFR